MSYELGKIQSKKFSSIARQSFLCAKQRPGEFKKLYYERLGKYGNRLDSVSATKFFDIIFNRRAKGTLSSESNPVVNAALENLHKEGLEDPFEECPEIRIYIETLLKKYQPQTELERGIVIARAIIPEHQYFTFNRNKYFGFDIEKGLGLNVSFNDEHLHPLRVRYGSLMPIHIFNTQPNERIALCLEYSFLLTSLLRAAGITARIKGDPSHAYVLAEMDKVNYSIDLSMLIFSKENNGAQTDREAISMRYYNKANTYAFQERYDEAISEYKKSLEFNPRNANALANLGTALIRQGNIDEGIKALKESLKIDATNTIVLSNLGTALIDQGSLDEGIQAYKQALDIDPYNFSIWDKLSDALFKQGNADESINAREKARLISGRGFSFKF